MTRAVVAWARAEAAAQHALEQGTQPRDLESQTGCWVAAVRAQAELPWLPQGMQGSGWRAGRAGPAVAAPCA